MFECCNNVLHRCQDLELTVADEYSLVENLEIFRKNGFEFVKDDAAAAGQRYKLCATPVSGFWTFGKEGVFILYCKNVLN